MPDWLWLLVVVIVLACIGQYLVDGFIRMMFFILALVVAIFAVWRLVG